MRTRSLPCPTLAFCGLLALGPACGGDDDAADGDDDGADASGDSSATGPTSSATTLASTDDTATDDADASETMASDTTDDGSETEADSTTGAPVCEITPGRWQAPDWDANTGEALALRAALDGLTGDPLMRGAETGAVVLTGLSHLTDAWAGDPNLSAIASPGFVAIVDQALTEFVDVIEAGEQDLVDAKSLWAPGPAGGVWGDSDRGINEGGLEVRQLVDKGGFCGLMYAYAVGLTEGDIDEATIDAIAAAWGSNAALDPMAMPTDAANYGYQMGFHADMAAALAAAKSYAADGACTAERDEALVTFFRLWEQSMLARLVFYGNRAQGKLLVATTDTELADVLHDLGEGIGVAVGLHGMPDPGAGPLAGGVRTITDAQLEEALGALGVDLTSLGASTTGPFVESLPALEAGMEAVEGVVMDVYGVDAAAIQGYVMPTPG